MKTTFFAASLLLCGPAIVVAQSDAPAAEQQDAKAAYKQLAGDFSKAMSAWQKDLRAKAEAARAAGEQLPRSAQVPPVGEFIGRAQELAKQYAGTDDAVRFLAFILKNAYNERNAVRWAVTTLTTDHAESDAIADTVDYLPGAVRLARRDAQKLLDSVAENHGHPEVRAAALLARARMNASGDPAAAIADLEIVQKLSKDADRNEEAGGLLEELRKFSVGAVAPDIDGVDVDGVAFKLSDYRGKAVLLDFWGFW